MFRLSLMAAALLASTPALAGENAFKADLENPTISAVISEFEQVCFPFISHETELTPEQDREVFQSRMIEAGYVFEGEKKWKQHAQYGQASAPMMYCPGAPTYERHSDPRMEGKYIVFPAIDKLIEGDGLTEIRFCEFGGPAFVRPFRLEKYLRQDYRNKDDSISATLVWQNMSGLPDLSIAKKTRFRHYAPSRGYRVKTSFLPASSCMIDTHDENLTAMNVKTAIIKNDADWLKRDVKDKETRAILSNAYNWTQCTKQDEESYVYSVSLIQGSFSVSVRTLKDDEDNLEYNCGEVDDES